MKTKYFIFAASALVALASCSNDEYIGDNNGLAAAQGDGSIQFSYTMPNATRADIYGVDAAKLLGKNFYVAGTKGTEGTNNPSPDVVFNNYIVRYTENSAGTTESNTANWEYVGVAADADHVKLSPAAVTAQTIKYWDYSTTQYDFLAFSTGTYKAVAKSAFTGDVSVAVQNDEIGVTAMKYGADLAGATAYTFYVPTADAIGNAYITDIVKVAKASYGKDVQLQFKNLGAKIRMAIYETVPGYSVKDVKFYSVDGTNTFTGDANKDGKAKLISADDDNGFVTKGAIKVIFPSIGTEGSSKADYNKASATVEPVNPATPAQAVIYKGFGDLNYTGKEGSETEANIYLGRTLPQATFAGNEAENYYQVVFPVSGSSSALTLRVDYTLVSTDGQGETINVYGAKAVVPSTYTVWQPNYAYTYIFKISDNTNGWTDPTGAEPAGLFPITFDAVVAEVKDASGQQTTISTVATPSITTYQQGHDKTKNEYSKSQMAGADTEHVKDLYVQVMDNSTADPALVTSLASDKSNSLIYLLSEDATEAKVMDALQMRTTAVGTVASENVTGRNGLVLTNAATNIDNTVTSIVNGADDKAITVTAGSAAKISIASLTKDKSYAYVYIPTAKTEDKQQFEYIPVTAGQKINSTETTHVYYQLTVEQIAGASATAAAEDPNAAANKDFVYFSVTDDGAGNDVYSYISPLGKASVPKGCKKVAKSAITGNATVTGNDNAAANTFYFDSYYKNNGVYAVKVFKVVE